MIGVCELSSLFWWLLAGFIIIITLFIIFIIFIILKITIIRMIKYDQNLSLKRSDRDRPEEQVLMRALRQNIICFDLIRYDYRIAI